MKEIIRLENVVKMYPWERRAVNDISLSVAGRQRVTVRGAPGSGKSVLMRLIAGMEKPSAGKIFVLDNAVHEMSADAAAAFRNRHIGVMQRDPGFIEQLSVTENVALPLTVRGVPVRIRNREARGLLKEIGLPGVVNALPAQLSVFEKMLAAAARMLIGRPQILLLDDIFAGLTERETVRLTDVINVFLGQGNYTMIFFCAEKSEKLYTDRTIRISGGKLQEDI